MQQNCNQSKIIKIIKEIAQTQTENLTVCSITYDSFIKYIFSADNRQKRFSFRTIYSLEMCQQSSYAKNVAFAMLKLRSQYLVWKIVFHREINNIFKFWSKNVASREREKEDNGHKVIERVKGAKVKMFKWKCNMKMAMAMRSKSQRNISYAYAAEIVRNKMQCHLTSQIQKKFTNFGHCFIVRPRSM